MKSLKGPADHNLAIAEAIVPVFQIIRKAGVIKPKDYGKWFTLRVDFQLGPETMTKDVSVKAFDRRKA
jgi:hypothetical protein